MKKIFCVIIMMSALLVAVGCGKKDTVEEVPDAPKVESPAVPGAPEKPAEPDAPSAPPVANAPDAGKPNADKPADKPTDKPVNAPSKPSAKPQPKPDPAPGKPVAPPAAASLSATDIATQIIANYDLPSMMAFDAETVASLYGIDTSAVKSYCVQAPAMDVKANEIAVFELSSASDAATFKKACEKRSKELAKTFEHYAADQFEIANAPSIVASGNYVFMAISEKASSMASDFKKLVK